MASIYANGNPQLVKVYGDLEGGVRLLDRQLAYWLARTPGGLLTSISGIGVTLAADTPRATLSAYYQEAWEKLLPKWKTKSDLKDVFDPAHPLGQWRNMVRELYAPELPLPQQRAQAKSSGCEPHGDAPLCLRKILKNSS